MQKLILPFVDTAITTSMDTQAYYRQYGFIHCGADLINRTGAVTGVRSVYSSGDGVVLGTGRDNVVGNVVIIKYYNAYHRATGGYHDIVFRYFHLNSISVKKGQIVKDGTLLGVYGNTGSVPMDPHLHVEADTDTVNYRFSPTVKYSNYIMGIEQKAYGLYSKKNTVQNVMQYLHIGQGQAYTAPINGYVRVEDRNLPKLPKKDTSPNKEDSDTINKLELENAKLTKALNQMQDERNQAQGRLKQIHNLSA